LNILALVFFLLETLIQPEYFSRAIILLAKNPLSCISSCLVYLVEKGNLSNAATLCNVVKPLATSSTSHSGRAVVRALIGGGTVFVLF
jgi:hypothetical protein